MRSVWITFVATVLACAAYAAAERCIGPMDNDPFTLGKGVPAINAADITWCDDFDTYCESNCGDCAATNPNPPTTGSIWPGYPPTPDNVCDGDTDVSSEYFYRRPYHWPMTGAPGSSSSAAGDWNTRFEGWNGNAGWITEPYTLFYQGFSNTSQYHTFSLLPAIQNKFPGSDSINGTDENPLILRFWAHTSWEIDSAASNWPFYVELRLDDDRAPTDWIRSADCTDIITVGEGAGDTVGALCTNQQVTEFPIVCQQVKGWASTTPPGGCPALSATVHSSLAYGWLAQLDGNPCNVDTGRKPTLYHTVVFDGVKWMDCYPNTFAFPARTEDGITCPAQVGKFVFQKNMAYCEMKIKTDVAEITLKALNSGLMGWELKTSTATVVRKYKGAFNRISIGAGPGCQIDTATGTCAGDPTYWAYPAQGGWHVAYMDRPALLGGVGQSTAGACCVGDACSEMALADCTAAGGTWRGANTVCDAESCLGACCQPKRACADTLPSQCANDFRGIGTSCQEADICPCPTPFADYDVDQDVDMNDFAMLQRCLNVTGGTLGAGCECFDKNDNGSVDTEDLEKFIYCGTGDGVEWTPTTQCP